MSAAGSARTWAVVIPGERFEAERLFHHDTLELTGLGGGLRPGPGDPVLVVRDEEPPLVVALGRVLDADGVEERDPDDPQSGQEEAAALALTYTRQVFDAPVPADRLAVVGPVTPVDPALYQELAGRVGPAPDRRNFLVSLYLPIEAASPSEAVRLFWSYVQELGPRELPAFVAPSGDELAMRAFVLGAEANQDPEEDD
ncbi:hypothetical protein ACN27G_34585 [Plantactinospora sp. WMMB334]|uniref:hypothetical protein n=1 Tax=Plantactinospora sp. WMMB334 TaxID=3404119 RepID=UPI003B930A83